MRRSHFIMIMVFVMIVISSRTSLVQAAPNQSETIGPAFTVNMALSTKSADPVVVTVPPRPSFDTVIAQLQVTQAQEAVAAAQAQQQAQQQSHQNWLSSVAGRVQAPGTYGNGYADGNCTKLVASMIPVPEDLGNADNWASNLAAQGWTTSATPIVGAIAQTTAGFAGHVAIVQSVNDDGTVTVIEENVMGWGVIDTQNYPTGYFTYIY